MNHIHAGRFTYGEIAGARAAKKIDGVLRLAGARHNRIGIEQKRDVGVGNEFEQELGVDTRRAIVNSEIDELIVEVAIENDDVSVWRTPDICDREFHADGVDQAEQHAGGDGEWVLNILISAVDRVAGRADADFASEDSAAEGFPEAAESRNVIPEGDETNAQARVLQARDQTVDLSGLAGAVNAGKTHEQRPMRSGPLARPWNGRGIHSS